MSNVDNDSSSLKYGKSSSFINISLSLILQKLLTKSIPLGAVFLPCFLSEYWHVYQLPDYSRTISICIFEQTSLFQSLIKHQWHVFLHEIIENKERNHFIFLNNVCCIHRCKESIGICYVHWVRPTFLNRYQTLRFLCLLSTGTNTACFSQYIEVGHVSYAFLRT